MAARMEQSGTVSLVHVSQDFHDIETCPRAAGAARRLSVSRTWVCLHIYIYSPSSNVVP